MNADTLNGILANHKKWLMDEEGGQRADLQRAYLQGADLQRADLREADLRGADLREADLQRAYLSPYQIPRGELLVYKKVQNMLVLLKIPRWAKRTASIIGRKCRASAAVVVAIESDETVYSNGYGNGPKTEYRIGGTVIPDSYDPDPRVECSHGIHFFLTREEAEAWQ